jgi:hypothetical protein
MLTIVTQDSGIVQVTMTLAALAATGAIPRPSGEDLQAQTTRIAAGITSQLRNSELATGGVWELVWLALSPDNANLAYIARTTDTSNQFAVVLRGTTASLTDILEDLEVGTVVPFAACGTGQVAVSKGAMAAFTQIVNATSIVTPGTTLVAALEHELDAAPSSPRPTVHVTGHSLGGCLATMLAPYLMAQRLPNDPAYTLITYAAPTAGLANFAGYVESLKGLTYTRVVNAFDLIPLAWTDLERGKDLFPHPPGPRSTPEVRMLLGEVAALTNGFTYAQPGAATSLNTDYDPGLDLTRWSTEDYVGQIGFQHASSTYLELAGAPPITAGPVVTSIFPTFGEPGTVDIFGTGFTENSWVDFGPVPAPDWSYSSPTEITVTVPPGTGIVDVRVTNAYGTSPAVQLGRFAYGGPQPLLVAQASPSEGPAGTSVTIVGTGFDADATVSFGHVPASSVTVSPPNQIVAPSPRPTIPGETVNITVTNPSSGVVSPKSPADEYSYRLSGLTINGA